MKLADRARTLEAVEALKELGKKDVYGDPETGEVSLPANGGTSILADVVRRMDNAGITLAELGLKQPTLDDVFLSLTGHTAEKEDETGSSPEEPAGER
jgi:ABC-2 type transport system ATP-binding protein